MTTSSRRSRGGQPSKGDRVMVQIKLPVAYREILEAAAADARVTLNDFGATLIVVALRSGAIGNLPTPRTSTDELTVLGLRLPTGTCKVFDAAAASVGYDRSKLGAILIARAFGLEPVVSSGGARRGQGENELEYDMAG